jgi:arabinofuranan 3-O-arabinosyltransferase
MSSGPRPRGVAVTTGRKVASTSIRPRMIRTTAPAAREQGPRAGVFDVLEVVALGLVAYIPFLRSSPHLLSSDTKQYLYVDPGRFLARALYMWDPHVAAGTVPHQQIGYLFPMGPYYWLMDAVGVPTWVAQRLWLGTISLAAALGARWLFRLLGAGRAGALAGALIYMLTPHQLSFTARISVLLLPWAALPWLVGLTMRATRRGGWRDPALFALVVLVIGGVNASALLLAGLAPALWLVVEALRGRAAARAAAGAAGRIGVLSVAVSLWWAIGLRLQGAYGLPVLQLTENVRTVSQFSSPGDLLRGLGDWFFYGSDRLGFTVDQAHAYVKNQYLAVTFSYLVPVVALVAGAVTRWRYRVYFASLVIAGTIVGVGAWPFDDPSPYGAVWKVFATDSSLGLALRNTSRVWPVIALGVAGLLAAAVGAIAVRRLQVAAAVGVGVIAFAALVPVWRGGGYLSRTVTRPSEIPSYWREAAAAMQRGGDATRVLEIPGANFAAYRWGNAIEPITPGLIDRPYLAREVLPYGSPQSVNLLDAIDRRIQEGTFEPSSLAPMARLFAVGTVALRSDLQYERFDLPRPRILWADLTQPVPPGLGKPQGFGSPLPNRPVASLPSIDEAALSTTANAPDPPPVALFPVERAVPIVHAAPERQPVVLAGDGDGIVDSAAAGLLNGDAQVMALASLDEAALGNALRNGADLVLTDSNRRRIENWFYSLRSTKGATERAGQTLDDPNGYDFRLDPFPGSTDASRTVVEQHGGRVDATGDGGAPRPEDRAVYAFDGDLRTSWRVGGTDPSGQKIMLRTDRPVHTDHITIVQPQDGPRDRVLSKVRIAFDKGRPVTVDLGAASLDPRGQVVRFPARTIRTLELTIQQTTTPPGDPARANAVGFAEVRVGDVRVSETVRLPVDFAQRVQDQAAGHRIDVVLTRLRFDPNAAGKQDEELALDRRFVLPDARMFGFTGTARIDPNAMDEQIDAVLGTTAPGVTYSSSHHLAGDADARASRAFDGNPATAWSAPIGPQEGRFLDVKLPAPITFDHQDLTVVADGRHSVPTRLRILTEAGEERSITVPPISDVNREGATQTVRLSFAPVTAAHFRVIVDAVRRVTALPNDPGPGATLPVSIAEAGVPGLPVPAVPATAPGGCRDDLVRVDGRPVPVRVVGTPAMARTGLGVASCAAPFNFGAGSHTLASAAGLDTAIDIDRVVLSSDRGGVAAPVATLGAPLGTSGASVRVTKSKATAVNVSIRTDGRPFWLVLGESASAGWKATAGGGADAAVGSRQVVDGYANGWLIRPRSAGTVSVNLRWVPQRQVWVGLGLSGIAVIVCLGIVVASLVRRRRIVGLDAALADSPRMVSPLEYAPAVPPSWSSTLVLAGAVGIATLLVSRPWIGGVAALATVIAARVPKTRVLLFVGAPIALIESRLAHEPDLAWLALAFLAVDLACGTLRARRRD